MEHCDWVGKAAAYIFIGGMLVVAIITLIGSILDDTRYANYKKSLEK